MCKDNRHHECVSNFMSACTCEQRREGDIERELREYEDSNSYSCPRPMLEQLLHRPNRIEYAPRE
jgi:hypothetical protein